MLLTDEEGKWFLEMESTGEDAVKTAEMTTKDSEYDINLVDKQQQGLRRLTPLLKEDPLWTKCYQTASLLHGVVCERRVSQSTQQTSLLSYSFKNAHSHPTLQQLPP